jgi:CPA2 family monovalent cation:H+ antiporter-2
MSPALARATHLAITLPHSINRNPLIATAKLINPLIRIFVRTRYIAEREELVQVGADAACYEEAEAAVALARLVLSDRGADEETIRDKVSQIRQEFQAPISVR